MCYPNMKEVLTLILFLLATLFFQSGQPETAPERQTSGPGFQVVAFTAPSSRLFAKGESILSFQFRSPAFPLWFSRMVGGSQGSGLQIPTDFPPTAWPKRLQFADTFTFYPEECGSDGRWKRRTNENTGLKYEVSRLSHSGQGYELALTIHGTASFRRSEGSARGGWQNTLLMVLKQPRKTALFFAFTPLRATTMLPAARPSKQGELLSRLLHKVDPVYPEAAKRSLADGVVEMAVRIGQDGGVVATRMMLLECPSFALCRSALRAVGQWRYEWSRPPTPEELEGPPGLATVTVNYVMRR